MLVMLLIFTLSSKALNSSATAYVLPVAISSVSPALMLIILVRIVLIAVVALVSSVKLVREGIMTVLFALVMLIVPMLIQLILVGHPRALGDKLPLGRFVHEVLNMKKSVLLTSLLTI
jgi:hypothetical protein